MSERYEKYERYGNEEEAAGCVYKQRLSPKPNHETQPKWIAEIGMVDPRRLGKPKNYKYRIEIIAKNGTKQWLRQFETKPENEPGRYAIPSEALSIFNDEYLISVSITKRGAER
ncbi:MAG: hypothetical protein R2941_06175 [Desulfobacterales bacterium]